MSSKVIEVLQLSVDVQTWCSILRNIAAPSLPLYARFHNAATMSLYSATASGAAVTDAIPHEMLGNSPNRAQGHIGAVRTFEFCKRQKSQAI
jgi:hypothetical protein